VAKVALGHAENHQERHGQNVAADWLGILGWSAAITGALLIPIGASSRSEW
jgi:hypothetical protein